MRRLRVLQEVARCGSLSGAAATLNYTTSAVSQQVTALERDIGAVLLVRGPSGTRPTPAGTRLLEHAERILEAVAVAERDLERLSTASPELVRIASFTSAAAAILPRALARFRSRYPRTEVKLLEADPDDGVALLAAGDVDAAIITEVPGEASPYSGIATVPVFDDEFYVVLPLDHPLATAAEVPLPALAADQWVVSTATGACPDTRVFHNACRLAGFVPSVTFRAEDYSTVQGLVAANIGVSLVPSLAASGVRADVVVRRVAGRRPVRRIAVATATPPSSGTALAALLTLVQAVGARLSADAACSVPARPFSVA